MPRTKRIKWTYHATDPVTGESIKKKIPVQAQKPDEESIEQVHYEDIVVSPSDAPSVSEPEQQSAHHRRQEKSSEEWQEALPLILRAYYKTLVPTSDDLCSHCGTALIETFVKCRDCGPATVFCKECAIACHEEQRLFHVPEVWQDGCWIKLSFSQTLKRKDHLCEHKIFQNMTVFDKKGRHHDVNVEYCKCEPLYLTLIRFSLWPTTVRVPRCAVDMHLMHLMTYLVLEAKTSLLSICHAIGFQNFSTKKEIDFMYRQIVGEAIDRFRQFCSRIRSLSDVTSSYPVPTCCPACPQTSSQFISLDANFGLVRRAKAGSGKNYSNEAALLFADDDEVSQFVEGYCDKSKETVDCHQFQAGNTIRSKNKTEKLDVTGVFGSACRHGIPKMFFNMKHSERLAYPILMIEKLIEPVKDKDVKPYILYDIACQLHSHLKKSPTHKWLLEKVKLCLPVFHAYGHNASCQVSYSTRWTVGTGLTDGETMERFWSFLRRFSHISKEMTPAHRVNLLTDASLHWCEKKIAQMYYTLSVSKEHAITVLQNSEKDLEEMFKNLNVNLETVKGWRNEFVEHVSKKKTQVEQKSWEMKYVEQLESYAKIRDQIIMATDADRIAILNTQAESLHSTICKMEEQRGISTRWKETDPLYKDCKASMELECQVHLIQKLHQVSCDLAYMKNLSKKYSDGQAVATRISKQIQNSSKAIRKALESYNTSNFSGTTFPPQLTMADVLDVDSPIYALQVHNTQGVPASLRQKAVNLLLQKERAFEEIHLVENEKENFITFYRSLIRNMKIDVISYDTQTPESIGKRCLLIQRITILEYFMQDALDYQSSTDQGPLMEHESSSDEDDS